MDGRDGVSIDWTKPLELMDGTPVRLETDGEMETCIGRTDPDKDGDYWIRREDGQLFDGWSKARCLSASGSYDTKDKPYVRNRA